MSVAVRQNGVAWVGGVLVVCRRIEFLSHVASPSEGNASAIRTFPDGRRGTLPKLPYLSLAGAHAPVPANIQKRAHPAGNFYAGGQYRTDSRCNFGSTIVAMRLHR